MRNHWQTIRLGEVLSRRLDEMTVEPFVMYKRVTIRMHGGGISVRDTTLGANINTKRQFYVYTGQFLLSKIDARNGAFGIVPDECDGAIITGNFWTFDVNEERLDKRYLAYLTRTEYFVQFCISGSEGTTNRKYLRENQFFAQEIPLPPLDEQRRIVAHIDALAARIVEARDLRLRAVEEAEALLGAYTHKVILSSDYGASDTIGNLCNVRGGIQKSANRIPTHSPRQYLTVAHVQRNWIDTSDTRYFEVSDEELERWRLLAGDVLVVEGNGSADQIGRTALFKGEIDDCVHQNHIIRVRPDQNRLLPEFLNLYLNSPSGQEVMRERSRTTSGLFHLSVDKIKSIPIILPTLHQQRRIVEAIQSLETEAKALKRLQAESAAELDTLLPSVLDRAFKGELVRDDMPASIT